MPSSFHRSGNLLRTPQVKMLRFVDTENSVIPQKPRTPTPSGEIILTELPPKIEQGPRQERA